MADVPYGYIYETTNQINGRKYIGKHKSQSFDSDYKGSGKILRLAYNKYGWENFSVRLLCLCFSKEELDNEEIFLIDYFNAVESHDYYNIARGGDGGDVTGGNHELHSHRTKLGMKNMSPEARARLSANAGKKLSQEQIQTMIEGNRRSWRTPERRQRMHDALVGNTFASHPMSDEQKLKRSEFHSVYQNTYEAKFKIALGRGREMLKQFIELQLPHDSPRDWDSYCSQLTYKRKYKSSYFLKYFDDWTSFINTLLERM